MEGVESLVKPGETCKYCGSGNLYAELKHSGPHYAAIKCGDCGSNIRWAGKPDALKKKRESKHLDLVKRYGRGYCEMCLNLSDRLPGTQTLEAHHVVPYKYKGSNDRDNIWILCTHCHRQVELIRTYLGHYGNQVQFTENPKAS